MTSTRTKRRYSPNSGPTRAHAYDALRGMVSHEPGPAMKGSVCGLALVLGVIGCNSDKRAAIRSLQQYYECVTVAGPAANDPGGGNAGLKACLMGKGWNQDTAYAISGSVYGERMLVAGLSETGERSRPHHTDQGWVDGNDDAFSVAGGHLRHLRRVDPESSRHTGRAADLPMN